MPKLSTIRADIAKLPLGRPLVFVLTGATTGIGSYIARAIAKVFKSHGDNLRVYIVGRNAARAQELLKFGRDTSPNSKWRFIQASDLSLITEVDRVSSEITRQENECPFHGGPARIDVLYMSQATSPLQKPITTSEGINMQMSLLYYSRIRFIQQLTPLLLAAPAPAHVISVFAGSIEDSIKPGDLPIGTPSSYGVTSVRRHTTFMKTFLFEELAAKHEGKISFIHIYPGLVDGPAFYSDVNLMWFRVLWRVLKLMLSWYMTSPMVCGEVMLSLASDRYPPKGFQEGGEGTVAFSTTRQRGGGAYGVGQRGDERKRVSYEKIRKADTAGVVWKHTIDTLETATNRRTQ